MYDWLGGAGGCVLSGPWRLTEPCDFTIGGATWLDQAQETAARANQNAGPQVRRRGNREPHQSVKGGGAGSKWGAGGGGRCNRQLQIHTEKERDQTTVHQQQKNK